MGEIEPKEYVPSPRYGRKNDSFKRAREIKPESIETGKTHTDNENILQTIDKNQQKKKKWKRRTKLV